MMLATPSASDTLAGRECALNAILRDVIAEYREYLEAAEAYEGYLQGKVDLLEALAAELGGTCRTPHLDLDEAILF